MVIMPAVWKISEVPLSKMTDCKVAPCALKSICMEMHLCITRELQKHFLVQVDNKNNQNVDARSNEVAKQIGCDWKKCVACESFCLNFFFFFINSQTHSHSGARVFEVVT